MKAILLVAAMLVSMSVIFAQSPSFSLDPNSKYVNFSKDYDDGNFYGASQLRIGTYLTLGNFGYSNASWIGSNALLDYTSYNGQGNGSRNEFVPMYAQGDALVMQLAFTNGDLQGWYHDWNSQTGAVNFQNFEQIWNLGKARSFVTSNFGIGVINPSAKLEVSGPANNAAIVLDGENFIGFKRADGALVYGMGHTGGEFIIGASANLGPTAGTPIHIAAGYTTAPIKFSQNAQERMRIANNGNVGIGTASPDAKLTVKGDIHAEEVRVDLNVPGPDYVFEEDYHLPTLESLQNYIRENKHLPEVPSAKEIEANGIDLGVMNMLLLKKVEELTLYILELKKENNQHLELIKNLQSEVTQLKNQ